MKSFLLYLLFSIQVGAVSLFGQSLKSPSEFLGYPLGSQFTRHHEVVDYYKHVSAVSDLVHLKKYGTTNERRGLYLAFISSAQNIANLETIRTEHLKRTGLVSGETDQSLAIVWLSYGVHGNESCSTEAAMLTLYKLLTERSDLLENTVVIMDPSLNPDGRDRYVNWYNQTKSTPHNPSPQTAEHQEPWPGGRANHYLFDLNRDWVWATQIETRQRLKHYNEWMPHVHVDFHEQGINSPYYFAPAAAPYHEVITDFQREFQHTIGKNNAGYFDQEGWSYFTKENFDLLYPSYGDTYPSFNGAIGMTYEQGGSGRAGLGVMNDVKQELTLYDRLLHHTVTGLSTIETASRHESRLNMEFEKYFDNESLEYKSYVLRGDASKIAAVKALMALHDITLEQATERSAKVYDHETRTTRTLRTSEADWLIHTDQPKGKLVKVLFEPETKLTDSASYDITAWNVALAYGLKGYASTSKIPGIQRDEVSSTDKPATSGTDVYAYVIPWTSVRSGAFLGALLQEKFYVRFAPKAFRVDGKDFSAGSLIVMKGENTKQVGFIDRIAEVARRTNQEVFPVSTGFVEHGYDFGSNRVQLITNRKIAVLSGEGTYSTSFGFIWHFFETQLKYPLHVLRTSAFQRTDLNQYQVLIIPEGYKANEAALKKLTAFVSEGGNVLFLGNSMKSVAGKEGFQLKIRKREKEEDEEVEPDITPYDQRERVRLSNAVNGSIIKSKVDSSHPLAFGYGSEYYSLKTSADAYEMLEKGNNVAWYPPGTAPISGFAGSEARALIPESLLFGLEQKGRGKLIYMVDNPLYRSFWENGKLFFVNAVFLQ